MKKQIFLFALLLGSFVIFAQQQIATLQHGDSISMYYGIRAFVDAHTAASNGDVITLSSGTFDACRITKAIKLRGAGAMSDSNNFAPTLFDSLNVGVYTDNDSTGRFTMEGILVSHLTLYPCTSPKFNRCIFMQVNTAKYSNSLQLVVNPQFINCVIKNYYNSENYCTNSHFVNSVVYYVYEDNATTFFNSIARLSSYSYRGINAYNSILVFSYPQYPLVSSGIYQNNILITTQNSYSDSVAFPGIYNYTNERYRSIRSVFENWDGTFHYDNVYKLKDSIANGFRGSDGSEVGIYGGIIPFAWTPSYMYIKKCNVANRSTADGKLSVDIEVITE